MNVKTKLYIFTIIFLLFLGNLMIYSSSMIWAEYITNNQYYYLIRQLIFTAISLIIFIICLKFDYKILKKHANKILIVTILLLITVLIPFLGAIFLMPMNDNSISNQNKIKTFSLIVSIFCFISSLFVWINFDNGISSYQIIENFNNIYNDNFNF